MYNKTDLMYCATNPVKNVLYIVELSYTYIYIYINLYNISLSRICIVDTGLDPQYINSFEQYTSYTIQQPPHTDVKCIIYIYYHACLTLDTILYVCFLQGDCC